MLDTECPGDAFYEEIQTWSHWVEDPTANSTAATIYAVLNVNDSENVSDENNLLKKQNLLI